MNNNVDPQTFLDLQKDLVHQWKFLDPNATVHSTKSVGEAMEIIRRMPGHPKVLITGSLHLIGAVHLLLQEALQDDSISKLKKRLL